MYELYFRISNWPSKQSLFQNWMIRRGRARCKTSTSFEQRLKKVPKIRQKCRSQACSRTKCRRYQTKTPDFLLSGTVLTLLYVKRTLQRDGLLNFFDKIRFGIGCIYNYTYAKTFFIFTRNRGDICN